jgi:hypothetical protein
MDIPKKLMDFIIQKTRKERYRPLVHPRAKPYGKYKINPRAKAQHPKNLAET